ncbi:DNA replication ATP-dependent helicase/nuclease JHS1 isoform X2 [Zea mays]|uniref:DNA replication ATP-dependent helicase/nuclease n=1 Tax=Zea mays TaxID=4577 RepID=A0A1D6E1N3_MAIZE|nr:DNA replication ATP-dependent helicase/nuclease JHS1 isoform X2 [Zea mays]ONM14575.1 Regulator of nonsense transcripts 1-like protein [Zea mays]ONM14579.1 Regulator of nonsense transcripts 1-like protein [Zea mays]ONM14583.1 Regulator of nonsense transcripts 1-like protein [Zea mays]|eukprot:XP_020403750.1 DNA replication ATP-dependent helicase/nuclease DNA2 isoform X2 [Zea mays]
MPPKKRAAAAASSKKPQPSQPSQPAKFGILHFFERQTQASQNAKRQKPDPPAPPPPPPPPPEKEPSEVSPEVTKTLAPKRVRFSPGMLIKQSQDDGVAEVVTWKISPVNHRLGTTKSKQFLGMAPHPYSSEKNSSLDAMKKWHSSPLGLSRCTTLGSNSGVLGSAIVGCDGVGDTQSPFRTPPSLSYGCNEQVSSGVTSEGGAEPSGAGQHKKALLDLLDQVEDAIMEEELPADPGNKGGQTTNEDITNNSRSPVADTDLTIPSKKTIHVPPFNSFLVLEVSEKHKADDSSCDRYPVKVLRLLNEHSGTECAVHLCDEWFDSIVGPGDTVNVIGEFSNHGKCIVDHDNNLVIVHPEQLISGTRAASSFQCLRRSVLDERLKSNEYSTSALTGTLLHQVFQAGLLNDAPSWQFLEQQAKEVLLKNIETLYACGVNESNMYSTLIEAIPKMLNWFKCFLKGSKCSDVDFGHNEVRKTVGVTEVMDIEEMAWAPRYGMKGVIDASVRSRVESHNGGSYDRIMPLEFKTGKATSGQAAMEHSAQVMLYTLLMTERYLNEDIDLGLLYYLHTDQTLGIKVKRTDLIGLIMRRNELATEILKASMSQSFPPMLQSPSTCNRCRHLISCTIYHKAHGGSGTTSGLGDLFDNLVNHLTVTHHNFLKHWDRLIDLEARASQVKKNILQPHNSNYGSGSSAVPYFVLDIKNGHSIDSSGKSKRYIYNFVQQKMQPETADQLDAQFDSIDFSLKVGDFVVLSTQSGRIAVANGCIREIISHSHITVSLPRRLRIPDSNSLSEQEDLTREIWRIDKDEFSSSFGIMRLNIVQLFAQNPQNSHLRKLIVDLEAPRFDSGGLFSQDPALSYIRSLPNLNNDQQRSLHKILGAKDYALILGMPGTGKTYTMVHAVKSLLIRGESILLTSYTNSAIDTLLMKLKTEGVDFIRIGRPEAVHPDVRAHCLSTTEAQSVDAIKARMEQVQVVGVTCLGMYHPLLAHKKFDTCIMDEAGQITLPVSLGPLMLATKFVLVGDHYQLPPLVQSSEARENGMGISLFWRLSEAHSQAISALRCQYRMSSGIMELSNSLIYGNRLCCGSLEIANAKLKFSGREPMQLKLKEILNPDRAVIFANTDQIPALEAKEHRTVNNPTEAHIISWIIKELLRRGVAQDAIGIITPYNAQVNIIQQYTDCLVEVHTIDKYQGRDKECIIVSFVRSTANSRASGSSLLGDWHRINVLLTRAKKKLIMVGSRGTLSTIPLLRLLVDKVAEIGGLLDLTNKDAHSFSRT